MERVVVIHGTMGSPQGNWFPWLKRELERRGVEAIVPQMPTPKGQSLKSWREAFSAQVGDVDSTTILIGHSVGAVFLLRLLEEAKNPVLASFFVAGFTGVLGIPEYDALNATFIEAPYDWRKIRSHQGKAICLLGEHDPYVPNVQGVGLAKHLGVDPVIIPEGGHLNAEFGFLTFPRILEELMLIGIPDSMQV